MNNEDSRIFIKSGEVEITIEGAPEFVTQQYQAMKGVLGVKSSETGTSRQKEKSKPVKISTSQKSKKSSKSTKSTQSTKPASSGNVLNTLGSDFGKWLANLPNSNENRDKILLAAYFKQTMNSDKKFYVHGIRDILKEYGISVSNIPGFLDTFEIQKIIYKVSASSRKGYQFTNEGEKHIKDLMAKNVK